jgi:hypothetical protein
LKKANLKIDDFEKNQPELTGNYAITHSFRIKEFKIREGYERKK